MVRRVPPEFSFELYSYLRRNDDLRNFILEFLSQFSPGEIRKVRGWRQRADRLLDEDEAVSRRDALVCYNGSPAGMQQFSVSLDGPEAYEEGIYVREEYRRNGLGIMLREILFSHLIQRRVERFYNGIRGPLSAPVLETCPAQAFAEKDILLHKSAVIELIRTPERNFVSSYGFDLSKYEFTYDLRGIELE